MRKVYSFVTFLAALSWFAANLDAQPTFAKDVAPIFQENCQTCHRPNDIAPFALQSFEDAQTWAEDIKRVVSEKIMPPWKPVAGYGEFKDVRGLTDDQRQTIVSWVNAGAPLGDVNDMPAPKAATGEWQLGDPDMIVQMPKTYTPPRGTDIYRCFVVSNPFDQAAYVSALDVIPGNRQIVHHVILFIDDSGASTKLDGKEEDPGYTCFGGPGFDINSISFMLGGWAPGSTPKMLPDGIAVQIPKGGRLVMQVHYFPFGRTGEDQTKIGLYFSKVPIERRLFYIPILNDKFAIPPGNSSFDVKASFVVPPFLDAKVVQIFPHMHVLGKKINVEFDAPQKQTQPLVRIDDWDFNWQGFYIYKDPVTLPAFSNLKVTCNFDNSDGNPKNPNDPLKVITWGEGTRDEMCIAFLGVTFDNENLLQLKSNP